MLKMRMISKILIKFKKDNKISDEDSLDEKTKVLYDKIRGLVLSSENSRLCALVELRKDMVKDYKEKYEKCAQELYDLKIKLNVIKFFLTLYRKGLTTTMK